MGRSGRYRWRRDERCCGGGGGGGTARYNRAEALARLLALTGPELETSPERLRANIARLARALRSERRRARAGDRGYDLTRHIALARAHAGETALLHSKQAAPRHRLKIPDNKKNRSAIAQLAPTRLERFPS